MPTFDEICEELEVYSKACGNILACWATAKDGYEQYAGEQMARQISALRASINNLSRALEQAQE